MTTTKVCSEAGREAFHPDSNHLFESAAKKIEAYSEAIPECGCWIWTKATVAFGHGRTRWNGEQQLAHRLSYKTFVGAIPDDMCVLHRCDVPQCVNPHHLFLGTHAENVADKVKKMRHNFGDRNGRRKLVAKSVVEIRTSNCSARELSEKFGVSEPHIMRIKAGLAWRHVNG